MDLGRITDHPLYNTWSGMIIRCYRKSHQAYRFYGARGITVCERWKKSFKSFVSDMGDKPSEYHSLDRINNKLGYSIDNCRWILLIHQNRNKSTNSTITMNGETLCLAEWAERLNISIRTIESRRRLGEPLGENILRPPRKRSKNRIK